MSSKADSKQTKNQSTSDVDMSEKAIATRLYEVGALYSLGISLMAIDMSKAKPYKP